MRAPHYTAAVAIGGGLSLIVRNLDVLPPTVGGVPTRPIFLLVSGTCMLTGSIGLAGELLERLGTDPDGGVE